MTNVPNLLASALIVGCIYLLLFKLPGFISECKRVLKKDRVPEKHLEFFRGKEVEVDSERELI